MVVRPVAATWSSGTRGGRGARERSMDFQFDGADDDDDDQEMEAAKQEFCSARGIRVLPPEDETKPQPQQSRLLRESFFLVVSAASLLLRCTVAALSLRCVVVACSTPAGGGE